MTKLFQKVASSIWETGGWLMPDGRVALSVQDARVAYKSGAIHFEPQKPYFQVKMWDITPEHQQVIDAFLAENPPPEDLGIQFRSVITPEEKWKNVFASDGTARLFTKKAEKTGNETFDRIWNDFHGDLNGSGHAFGHVFNKYPPKQQVLVALGKMNYMVDNGGFARWIEEDYGFETGDLLLKKLPYHNHAFPVLSKVHDLVAGVLDAYGEFGVHSYADLEHLLKGHRRHGVYAKGPDRDTLWKWFKKAKSHLFESQKYIQSPHDLDYITGKWGSIRFDEEPLNAELVESIEEERSALENTGLETAAKEHAVPEADLARLRDLGTVLAVLDDRFALQEEWKRFKDGEWTRDAEAKLDALDTRYHETVVLPALVKEAKEWFDSIPDEVSVVEPLKKAKAKQHSNLRYASTEKEALTQEELKDVRIGEPKEVEFSEHMARRIPFYDDEAELPRESFLGKYQLVKSQEAAAYIVLDGEKPIARLQSGYFGVLPEYRNKGIGSALAKIYTQEYPEYKPRGLSPQGYRAMEKALAASKTAYPMPSA